MLKFNSSISDSIKRDKHIYLNKKASDPLNTFSSVNKTNNTTNSNNYLSYYDKKLGRLISLGTLCKTQESLQNEDKLRFEITSDFRFHSNYFSNQTQLSRNVQSVLGYSVTPTYESFKEPVKQKVNIDSKKVQQIYRKGLKREMVKRMIKTSQKEQLPQIKTINKPKNREKRNETLPKQFIEIQKIFNTCFDEYNNSNNKNMQIINTEISVGLRNYFQLLNSKFFNKKFQDFQHYKDEEIEKKKEQEYKAKIDKLLNQKFESDIKEIDMIITKNKVDIKREKIKKYKRCIRSAALHFLKLNITLEEFFSKKNYTEKPYERNGSKELFRAIKEGREAYVLNVLNNNKYLVNDYDFFIQTPLHWAAKRGHINLISILFKYGAYIDAVDYYGDTPLIMAVKKSHSECVRVLLVNNANPNIVNKDKKTASAYSTNNEIKYYLTISKAIYRFNNCGSIKETIEKMNMGLKSLLKKDDRVNKNKE